jgi:hypothetical protein
MPFKRLHSNGLEIVIHLESTQREWWLVRVKSGLTERSTILGLKTSLNLAKALGTAWLGLITCATINAKIGKLSRHLHELQ